MTRNHPIHPLAERADYFHPPWPPLNVGLSAATASGNSVPSAAAIEEELSRTAARRRWAALVKRVYEVDPLVCPKCGGEMRVIAFIERRR